MKASPLEWERRRPLSPPAPHVGALLDEAVDDDAVAVDRCVLVVEGVDERLGQVEQSLLLLLLFVVLGEPGKANR